MPKRRHTMLAASLPRRRVRNPEQAAFPTLEPFAARLEQLRLERGLTQRALAERATISANHYQDIAHARANPTVIVLLHLAEALGVPLVELFEYAPSSAHEHCTVRLADLRELAAQHERLTDVVKRLAKTHISRRASDTKRP